jgi:hypothetical protein
MTDITSQNNDPSSKITLHKGRKQTLKGKGKEGKVFAGHAMKM